MTRVKKGFTKHHRHKKVLKFAKGYRASNSKLFRVANQQVMKAVSDCFADRSEM